MPSSSAPATHTRKKPYQPSITSFLHPRSQIGTPSSSASAQTHRAASPALPADVQADLLSVGMRVRKSVNDGHLTAKGLAEAEASGQMQPALGMMSSAPVSAVLGREGDEEGQRGELMPFCGLHKVGGFGVQSSGSSGGLGVPGLVGGSQSTQESVGTGRMLDVSARDGGKKRGFEEEIEEDMDAFFEDFGGAGEDDDVIVDRPIARVKGSVGKSRGVESVRVVGDFEDAAFLAPVEGMGLDDGW